MSRVSWVSWTYIAVVVAAAAAVLLKAPAQTTAKPAWWGIYVTLAILFLICDSTPTPLATRRSAWSPSSAATLAAVVMLGQVGAAMVGAVAVLSLRKLPVAERLFNGAMYTLAGFAAGSAYVAVGGHVASTNGMFATPAPNTPRLPMAGMFTPLILPYVAAATVHVVVNHGLIWQMLRLDRRDGRTRDRASGDGPEPGTPPTPESGVPLLMVSDLGLAGVGLVIAALWTVIGPFAAAIVLAPLFVARWAMGQFAKQQGAYTATIAALCQAVETKDFYTRGHSERVSRGSSMIARQIGMRTELTEAVTFAGMLHDVGKLGVPTNVLQKEGPLTEEEFAAIQLHPMRGLDIIREIGFLNEALNGIMFHHERMDGTGYPMGFAGYEIPLFARIIAVADAFDSMTSTRSYRKARPISQAVAELHKGSGAQFDPKIVQAFTAALEREGWQLPRPAKPRPNDTVTFMDHDDPLSPLRVVGSA